MNLYDKVIWVTINLIFNYLIILIVILKCFMLKCVINENKTKCIYQIYQISNKYFILYV